MAAEITNDYLQRMIAECDPFNGGGGCGGRFAVFASITITASVLKIEGEAERITEDEEKEC